MLLMLYCGLRPSETSAVQGHDITGHILHIRGTKTKYADRYVPIPNALINVLPQLSDNKYLCPSATGIAPTKREHRQRMWRSFKKELGKYIEVKNDLVPYCLRHTYCTDLQDAGVPINVAKDLMGHSSINLTSKIYTHMTEETFEKTKMQIDAHVNVT